MFVIDVVADVDAELDNTNTPPLIVALVTQISLDYLLIEFPYHYFLNRDCPRTSLLSLLFAMLFMPALSKILDMRCHEHYLFMFPFDLRAV